MHAIKEENKHLVEDNLQLVPYTLAHYFGTEISNDEDFLSIGNIGLCKAAATYNPAQRAQFSTYACVCIANEIKNYFTYWNNPSRSNKMRVVSLNEKAFDDEDDLEIIDTVYDESFDVENDVIDRLVCEELKEYTPMNWEMLEGGYSVSEYAKKLRKSRDYTLSKLNRELRIARAALKRQIPNLYQA